MSETGVVSSWGRPRILAVLFCIFVMAQIGFGQVPEDQGPTQPRQGGHAEKHLNVVPGGRPSIGLVLEGGGALGIAHVGVLKWMREHRIPVDGIAGTSMGALIGSIAASGESPEEIERVVTISSFDDLFTVKPSFGDLSFRRREDRDDLPQAVTLGLRGGTISPGNSVIADAGLNAFLSRQLVSYNAEKLNFDDLPIPFRCVATDLSILRPEVFSSGSLPFAVRASISIPGLFPPVRKDGHFLVDGAIMDNLPTDVARNDLHADVVIAVHLSDSVFEEKDGNSLFGVFARTLQAGTSRNEEISRLQADIEITPDLDRFSSVDYDKAEALEKMGYEAAERQREKLLPYALSETNWTVYIANLESRKRLPPGQIKTVRVEGPDPATSAKVGRSLAKLDNRVFDATRAEAVVSDVRGGGALDAYYETFHTPAPTDQSGNESPVPDDGIVLHWQRKPDGPPYLMLGTDVVAMNSNVTSTVFDARFLDENLGSYGSELRADVRLGYLTRLGTEFYQPLGSNGFFVQPRVQLLRQPIYLWQDQKRVSERLLQRAGGGVDAGITLNRNLQAAIEYRTSTIRWNLKDGVDDSPTPHLSGIMQSAAAHVIYSNRTAAVASPRGTRVDLTIGHLFDTSDSREAPFMVLNVRQSVTFAQKNMVSLSADANTYFRNNVADPLRFTLGGPLHLYASSIDEYRGTDTVLTRAIYLRRFAALPTGLGEGVYFTGGYEAGSVWSPEQHSLLREDGFGGVLLSTPLGAITLGGAVGDAGRRKVFFTFGKLF